MLREKVSFLNLVKINTNMNLYLILASPRNILKLITGNGEKGISRDQEQRDGVYIIIAIRSDQKKEKI